MEKISWLWNLPTAYKTIMAAPNILYESALNEKLEEIRAEFVWLDEIYEEAVKLFSVKSTKLVQMPKTPSMKQKGKKGRRSKVMKEITEIKEETPVYPKGNPTKLKFDSPKNVTVKSDDDAVVNDSGRPVRGCRKTSRPTYADEIPLPKRSTRLSKKPRNSPTVGSVFPESSVTGNPKFSSQKPPSENPEACPFTNDLKLKMCKSVAKQKSEEKSPSVRERTKAYESMLKMRMSESPVLKAMGAGKATQAVPAVGAAHGVSSCQRSPRGHRSALESGQSVSEQSSRQHTEISSEASDTRQTRTRLRLKKQTKEDIMVIEEAKQPDSGQLDGQRRISSPDTSEGPAADVQEHEADEGTCLPQRETFNESVTVDICGQQRESLNETVTIDICGQQRETLNETVTIDICGQQREIFNETVTVITEVYDIGEKGKPAALREFEIVHTKTTPVCPRVVQGSVDSKVSDQGFNDGDGVSTNESSGGDEVLHNDSHQTDSGGSSYEVKSLASSTRTRTRAQKKQETGNDEGSQSTPSKDSGVVSEVTRKADHTFVKEKKSLEPETRVTRTRARAEKESETSQDRMTRTRQRIQDEAQKTSEAPSQPVRETCAVTRSRMKKALDPSKLAICGSDDEIIAGSPVVATSRPSLRGAKKRLADERGLSPRPKRSCVGDESTLNIRSPPQSTSSPLKLKDGGLMDEAIDKVASARRSPRAFKFSSAQKVTSGFMNRTPGFGQNTSRLCSFLSNTPTCRSTSFLTSFLKRNTPPPKQNTQILQEQKRQKLLEKENRDKERLKRAADLRKRRIEDQKRLREEKEQKVAEAREIRLKHELETKNRINKKLEDKAIVKAKLLEEKVKEEREKQKQRLKKQIEADTRRKIEEEERLKKFLEQEEEAKMHEEFMQRKREFEEAERRRQIAEDKRKHEERLAELEQKRQEELLRLRQAEEEKERERERIRLEKEKQIAHERAERERFEREKREERDRKIQEEKEKLKVMERERLRIQQEKLQQQKQEELQQSVIKQMINKHNTSLSKQPAAAAVGLNSSTSTNTSLYKQPAATGLNSSTSANTSASKINSYEMTPAKKKVVSQNQNPDNYDIDDKGSDDSTDDEEAPMKRIPEWATGIPLNTALIRQHMDPPDIEAIFRTSCIEPPNLLLVFPGKKRLKYIHRTSSANWNSPPMSRH